MRFSPDELVMITSALLPVLSLVESLIDDCWDTRRRVLAFATWVWQIASPREPSGTVSGGLPDSSGGLPDSFIAVASSVADHTAITIASNRVTDGGRTKDAPQPTEKNPALVGTGYFRRLVTRRDPSRRRHGAETQAHSDTAAPRSRSPSLLRGCLSSFSSSPSPPRPPSQAAKQADSSSFTSKPRKPSRSTFVALSGRTPSSQSAPDDGGGGGDDREFVV